MEAETGRGPLRVAGPSYVIDTASRVVSMNAAAEALLGWREDEARGRASFDLFVAPARKPATLAAWGAWRHRGPRQYVGQTIGATVCHRDGTEHDVEVHLSVESPEPRLLLRVELRVVSEEARFTERERILGSAAMRSGEAVVRVDALGVVQAVNPAAERLARLPASRLVRQPVGVGLGADARDARTAFERVRDGHLILGAERRYALPDGGSVHVEIDASRETDEAGAFAGVTFVVRDVSEVVRAREDLEGHLARLRALPRPTVPPDRADASAERNLRALLARALRHLRLDAVWAVRFDEGASVLQAGAGLELICPPEMASVGAVASQRRSLLRAMLDGVIPPVVADVAADPRLREAHAMLPPLVAFVGAPVVLSDGTLHGAVGAGSPREVPGLGEQDQRAVAALADVVAHVVETARTVEESASERSQRVLVDALLAALDARDRYTAEHSAAVVHLAGRLADALGPRGCHRSEVELVARLHDIGKLGIPDAVLHKPGPLDPRERQLMEQHPAIGERIVAGVPHLAHLAPAIRAEHERWDGDGYPDGVLGEAIPLPSRIVLACDAWHAMRSDRPYRRALSVEAALSELRTGAGAQFDPEVVDVLLRLLEADGEGGGPTPPPAGAAGPPPVR